MNTTKSKDLQLFIADDSAAVRDRLVAMLGEVSGVEVVGVASSAAEAAERICELKPDAVTLDIRMPDGTGLDVLQEIRRRADGQELDPVVIMLSNYCCSHYRKIAMRSGANYFFDKSSEFEKVKDVLLDLTQPGGFFPLAGGMQEYLPQRV